MGYQMSDPAIIEWMRRLDEKIDSLQEDITGLKESRAETKGVVKTAAAISGGAAGLLAWAVSQFFGSQH